MKPLPVIASHFAHIVDYYSFNAANRYSTNAKLRRECLARAGQLWLMSRSNFREEVAYHRPLTKQPG